MGSTTAEVLRRAADLIEPQGAWTQGAFGRLADMQPVGQDVRKVLDDLVDDAVVCRCALGAIVTAYGRDYDDFDLPNDQPASVALSAVIDCRSVALWNDHERRTQAEVVAKLREAARRQEAEGAPSEMTRTDTGPLTLFGADGETEDR